MRAPVTPRAMLAQAALLAIRVLHHPVNVIPHRRTITTAIARRTFMRRAIRLMAPVPRRAIPPVAALWAADRIRVGVEAEQRTLAAVVPGITEAISS